MRALLITLCLCLISCAEGDGSDYPISDAYGGTEAFQRELQAYYGLPDSFFKICSHYKNFCLDPYQVEDYAKGQ